jgi:hypothetical protein
MVLMSDITFTSKGVVQDDVHLIGMAGNKEVLGHQGPLHLDKTQQQCGDSTCDSCSRLGHGVVRGASKRSAQELIDL